MIPQSIAVSIAYHLVLYNHHVSLAGYILSLADCLQNRLDRMSHVADLTEFRLYPLWRQGTQSH